MKHLRKRLISEQATLVSWDDLSSERTPLIPNSVNNQFNSSGIRDQEERNNQINNSELTLTNPFQTDVIMTTPYTSLTTETKLGQDEESIDGDASDSTRQKLRFVWGCFLAFMAGLLVTVNGFLTKGFNINSGEILVVKGILQTLIMAAIVYIKGHTIIPTQVSHRIMTLAVGIMGTMCTFGCFACVLFMPVGDATTLMFTNPLFTIIFAAVFLRQRLTFIKVLSGTVLMAGIVLVTKPPCLFGSGDLPTTEDLSANSTSVITAMVTDYLDRDFEVFEMSQNTTAADAVKAAATSTGGKYSVGAIIALTTAMFTAGYSCIMSKLDGYVGSSVQLLYMGIFCLPISTLCLLFEDPTSGAGNRFFNGSIADITLQDWLAVIGVSLSNLLCSFTELKALAIVPPSVFATLRTSQIIVAFAAQCIMNSALPAVIDVAGAGLVFAAAMAVTFEPRLSKLITFRRGYFKL